MLTYSYSELLWSVGSRIREARKAKGLTQEQLAELTGLDRVAVGYLEQGRRAPRLKTLHTLADKLDVDVSYFTTTDHDHKRDHDQLAVHSDEQSVSN
jgi:transcriptional regulator with XRE-family HTH domain